MSNEQSGIVWNWESSVLLNEKIKRMKKMNKEKRALGFVQWALSLKYEVQRKKV